MTPENTSGKSYWYGRYEGYELRSQVIELQSRIRQLEAELTAYHVSQELRLARYRETYYETTWIELEIQE